MVEFQAHNEYKSSKTLLFFSFLITLRKEGNIIMHKTKKKSFNMCSGTSGKRSYTQVILRIRQFGVDNSVLLRLFPHVQKRETDRYVEQLQSRCRRKERKRELGGQTQENTADVFFLSTVFFFFTREKR
jgi:hypothetical protein